MVIRLYVKPRDLLIITEAKGTEFHCDNIVILGGETPSLKGNRLLYQSTEGKTEGGSSFLIAFSCPRTQILN